MMGQKLVDIVKAGVAEWYEVARQEAVAQIMPSVESGEIASWDAQRLQQLDVDTEWIKEEWNKLQKREDLETEEATNE